MPCVKLAEKGLVVLEKILPFGKKHGQSLEHLCQVWSIWRSCQMYIHYFLIISSQKRMWPYIMNILVKLQGHGHSVKTVGTHGKALSQGILM